MIAELNKRMSEESENLFPNRRVIFGEGKSGTDIMLIGEAPGGEEDKQGRPFVGAAGKNLNEFLEILGIEREDIYISNVVKLRPFKLSPKTNKPVNRPPNREELDFFVPYMLKEIGVIQPKLIVTLGNFALKAVLQDNKVIIGDCHGKVTEKNGLRVFPLYHPASVIYNRSLRDVYLDDLEKLKVVVFGK